MPRFYFHLWHDRQVLTDGEGLMLADAFAARDEARRTIRDFFWPALGTVDPDWAGWRIDLCDARGCRVLDIGFDEAPRLHAEFAAERANGSPATALSTHIDSIRRDFAAAEDRANGLLGRARALVEEQRGMRHHLAEQLDRTKQLRTSTLELVARARHQSNAGRTMSRHLLRREEDRVRV